LPLVPFVLRPGLGAGLGLHLSLCFREPCLLRRRSSQLDLLALATH